MECSASVLMITPVLLPAAIQMGVDPIHFGVIVVMTLSLGMATPPVGENLYIAAGIAEIKFENMLKYVWPLLVVSVVAITLVMFIPGIAMFFTKYALPETKAGLRF